MGFVSFLAHFPHYFDCYRLKQTHVLIFVDPFSFLIVQSAQSHIKTEYMVTAAGNKNGGGG